MEDLESHPSLVFGKKKTFRKKVLASIQSFGFGKPF